LNADRHTFHDVGDRLLSLDLLYALDLFVQVIGRRSVVPTGTQEMERRARPWAEGGSMSIELGAYVIGRCARE
jgi:hypothetical protein